MQEQPKTSAPETDLNEIVRVRREKLAELQANGHDPFCEVKYDRTHHASQITSDFDKFEGATVSVAGRLMSKRGMGKLMFCDLTDLS